MLHLTFGRIWWEHVQETLTQKHKGVREFPKLCCKLEWIKPLFSAARSMASRVELWKGKVEILCHYELTAAPYKQSR